MTASQSFPQPDWPTKHSAPLPSESGQTRTGGRMGGHAPSASDWHRGKVPGFEQVHGAPQKGDVATDGKHVGLVSRPGKTAKRAGAKQALGRTWQELSTNQELHKGVEFGVKTAGEVGGPVSPHI